MLRTVAIIVFVLPFIARANEEILNAQNATFDSNNTLAPGASDRNANGGARVKNSLPSLWVADMFYQALANFTIQERLGSTTCQLQTQLYIRHLKNNSYWAVQSEYPNTLSTFSFFFFFILKLNLINFY